MAPSRHRCGRRPRRCATGSTSSGSISKDEYALVFRAYDEGVAYRFETAWPQAAVTVDAEEAVFAFVDDFVVFYAEEQSFFSHNERHYLPRALADLAPHNLGSLPAVVDAGAVKVAIAESDIEGYPGLWLRGTAAARSRRRFRPTR
jgi:alpha-glucosidase